MNLNFFILGDQSTRKKSAQQLEADEAIARYAKLVESAVAQKKTWAEMAEQIKKMKPIALGVSSAELIRSIRDEL